MSRRHDGSPTTGLEGFAASMRAKRATKRQREQRYARAAAELLNAQISLKLARTELREAEAALQIGDEVPS